MESIQKMPIENLLGPARISTLWMQGGVGVEMEGRRRHIFPLQEA